MKIALSKRQRAVLEVMSKPKIPAEIREGIGLKKNNNMSSTIKELVNQDLLYCLNPKARLGKLYGLTKKGIGLRKKIGYGDYCQPKDIDWKLYGWVVCGKQKSAISKAFTTEPMTLRQIRERAREHNRRISRTNVNDVLQLLVKGRLAKKTKGGKRVIFNMTRVGQRIRVQLTRH